MKQTPVDILDLSYPQLREWLAELHEPVSRADQLMRCIYRDLARSFEDMTALPGPLQEKLVESAAIATLNPVEERVSRDGQTRKLLFELDDGNTIESTLMLHSKPNARRERRTVCLSSQVGCPIGCPFCATGQQGFVRNLRPGEMVEQVLFFMRYLRGGMIEEGRYPSNQRVTNVVFMGMGEPLANYDNVRQAILILNSPLGLGMGVRQVTLSTSGLVPRMVQLATGALQFELAVSLHAATDSLRDRLVPINRKYPLAQLRSACRQYIEKTGRRPAFEDALFSSVNASFDDADDLVRLLDGLDCSINLIVGNPTLRQEFQPSSPEVALAFQKRLIAGGIRTMIRVPKGIDIDAGCGQLRSRWLANHARPGTLP